MSSASRTTTAAPRSEPRPSLEAEPAERRPGRTGHAWYAEEARRALGVTPWLAATHLPDIPAPVFQGVVAGIASLVVVLVRPAAVGLAPSIALDAGVAALCCAAIVVRARVLLPDAVRPGLEVAALPAAALLSLAVAVSGTGSALGGVAAVAITALVVALVPHLDTLRLAGRAQLGVRLGLDAAAIVVAVPLALVGAAPSLAAPWRLLLAGAGCAGLCFDALRLDTPEPRRSLRGAALVGGIVGLGALASPLAVSQASGATSLLLLWYGLRGLAATAVQPRPRPWLRGIEYGAFVAGAIVVLVGRGLPLQ